MCCWDENAHNWLWSIINRLYPTDDRSWKSEPIPITTVDRLAACNITTCPIASCKWIWRKTAVVQAEQDPGLPCSTSNVLGKVQYNLCLTEWRGKWKCRRVKSTLGAACPAQRIMFCNLCCTLVGFNLLSNWLWNSAWCLNSSSRTCLDPVSAWLLTSLCQGLSRNASSVSFGHAEHCFLTVWTPKSLCQNLLKMTFLRR